MFLNFSSVYTHRFSVFLMVYNISSYKIVMFYLPASSLMDI